MAHDMFISPERYPSHPPKPLPDIRKATPPRFSEQRRESPNSLVVGSESRASRSHPDRNEDSFYHDRAHGLSYVGDGVGGYGGGEYASELVGTELRLDALEARAKKYPREALRIQHVRNFIEARTFDSIEQAERSMAQTLLFLNDCLEQDLPTDERVQRAIMPNLESYLERSFDENDPRHRAMKGAFLKSVSTTAVLGKTWVDGSRIRHTLGSVGDSRALLVRDGKISQLTADHSPISILVERGVKNTRDEVITLESADEDPTQRVRLDDVLRLAAAQEHPELGSCISELAKQWKRNGILPELLQIYQKTCAIKPPLPTQAQAQFLLRALAVLRKDGLPQPTLALRDIRHVMFAALGGRSANERLGIPFRPFTTTIEVFAKDIILKLSDGITDNLSMQKILAIVARCEDDMELCAHELVEAAYEASGRTDGKKDDMTVLIEQFAKQ